MVMASLRADYFDTKGDRATGQGKYNQVALSPKFGVVYQPVLNKVSIFANYMNAFINVAPRLVMNPDSSNQRMKSFRPEHADQLEFGVKALLLDKLQATVSVYDIKVSDRVLTDARNPLDYTQGGKVRSRGIEIDINAHPLPELNIIAGYSHNSIKVVSGAVNDFYAEVGRAPGGQGAPDLANLWAPYKFSKGIIRNLGIGLGGNYASRYKVIDNSKTGIFYLPEYAVLNGSLFYNAKHFRITVTLNNITSEVYYTGYWSVNPQKPRNFTAGFAYKF